MRCGLEATQERGRGHVAHFLARRPPDRLVGGDETDPLPVSVPGGEPLEQGVGVRGVPHRERPDLMLLADTVEDDHTPRSAHRDEAGELVDELAHIGATAGVQDVVAVEQVERRLGHRTATGVSLSSLQPRYPVADVPRTAAPLPRR